jgi:hypothetical protein
MLRVDIRIGLGIIVLLASNTLAFAQSTERMDIVVGILLPESAPSPEPPDMKNSPQQWQWKIPVHQWIEDALVPLLRDRAADIKVVRTKGEMKDQENAIFVKTLVSTSRSKSDCNWSGCNGNWVVHLDMSIESNDRELWKRRYDNEKSFRTDSFADPEDYKKVSNSTINSALAKGLADGVRDMFSDRNTVAALEALTDSRAGASGNLFEGLQPLLATYRVSESEGIVRKKPATKGSTVRKLGMGSIVQVIGKLPTGWLQVAKEGEAIGWIHEGSVQAMSVQSQPAMAAAPAKPGKPVAAPVAVSPAPTFAAPAPTGDAFPTKPVAVSFPRGKAAPDDIAVIIGNANYKATAKDIPDVVPAYADAEGMKRYATQALGIREENVIFIKDAKLVDFVATFGTSDNHKGKLFNWVKPGQTNVFVFYSGHGAPSGDGGSSYLVPVDAQGSLIELSAYPIRTLYGNLSKLPAKSVTVVLEACFSGSSQAGTVIKNASPVFQKALQEAVPPNLNVITAASGTQIASWEQDKSHGLFTKHYLLGMAGAADKKPYGNGDGKVSTDELTTYLKGTMSYMAQRYYGREQVAQVATGKGQ